MLKRPHYCLGLAIVILFLGCPSIGSSSPNRPSSEDEISSAQASAELGKPILPGQLVNPGETLSVTLPKKGMLVAFTRWGSTTLAVFDVLKRVLVPVATTVTGEPRELLVSFAAYRVATLVRKGVNPARNYIEVIDMNRRRRQLVEPAKDSAILGFTLSPSGTQLAYAEINLKKSNSHRVHWRTKLTDLERNDTQISVASGPDRLAGEGIPVPFSWSSRTGEVYLQGLLPFRGMVHHGIWAMKPDGSGLRKILPEPSYTGLPRLSPDGGSLAFLAPRIEALPQGTIPLPGAPPGNVLVVVNLFTGEQSAWARQTRDVFGTFAWSTSGREILVSRQEWVENRFRDIALLSVGKDASLQLSKIVQSSSARLTGIGACEPGSFLWVEEDHQGTRVRGSGGNHKSSMLLSLPGGKIQLVGCIGK
ncbi:MAG: hypothetical protein ACE5JU_12670 [Candidatus Binatia bacterium]